MISSQSAYLKVVTWPCFNILYMDTLEWSHDLQPMRKLGKRYTVRVEHFEGGKFRALQDFVLFRKFRG